MVCNSRLFPLLRVPAGFTVSIITRDPRRSTTLGSRFSFFTFRSAFYSIQWTPFIYQKRPPFLAGRRLSDRGIRSRVGRQQPRITRANRRPTDCPTHNLNTRQRPSPLDDDDDAGIEIVSWRKNIRSFNLYSRRNRSLRSKRITALVFTIYLLSFGVFYPCTVLTGR